MSMSIAEAKGQFSAVIERAAAGEEVIITKHGKIVAKIVSADARDSIDPDELLRQMQTGRTATIGASDWKELRDFGRRF